MVKYLITGCARSGTGFFAKMFNDNGISCGHEKYFNPFSQKNKNIEAESSWMGTSEINNLNENVNIVRIYKNPFEVIKSHIDLDFFNKKNKNSSYFLYMKKNIPELNLFSKNEFENAAIYYIKWNLLFDELINNKKYITINFNELIKMDNFILFNKNFKIPKNIINDKKHLKYKNIQNNVIIDNLKKYNYYDKVMNIYNKLNSDINRII